MDQDQHILSSLDQGSCEAADEGDQGVYAEMAQSLSKFFDGAPLLCQIIDEQRKDEHFMSFFKAQKEEVFCWGHERASDDDEHDYDFNYEDCRSPVKDESGAPLLPEQRELATRHSRYDFCLDMLPSSPMSDPEDVLYNDVHPLSIDSLPIDYSQMYDRLMDAAE
ncbi:hypothetical protein BGZ67_010345 [Mortierella alpina]|nr:hypothetical protein BGZ67_010345 [Mortierella alpina]